MRRLLVDASFTRTQAANVGITRTVKRLLGEFTALAPASGMTCTAVAFHTSGFRELPRDWSAPAAAVAPPAQPALDRAMNRITNGPLRELVSTRFPLPLRRLAWLAYSWWEFDRLSRDLPAITFTADDVLFLSDASWNYPVWKAARMARSRGAKVVTVVYDLIPLRQPQFCPALTTIAFRQWLAELMPISDGVLCISRAVESDLHLYAREMRIVLPKTASFRLGCDPAAGATDSTAVRGEIRDFITQGPCFTAIGSIEPRKNYGFLLDGFERLWSRGLDTRLLIVGRRTTQCADLLARMDGHEESGKRLLFVSDGNDEEVAYAYTSSRALLFPSLAEGFGLPLVEARARGCRVIASDLPAFAELADEGVRLFPAGVLEAFEALVEAHLAEQAAPPRVTPFAWSDSARRCLAFIEELPPRRIHY